VAGFIKHVLAYICYLAAAIGCSALKGGALELCYIGMEGMADPKIPDSSNYHVKFGSSAINGERINRKEPQKLGVLGPRPLAAMAWLTP